MKHASLVLSSFVCAAAISWAPTVLACGGFTEAQRVGTVDESAIIVFDKTKQEERFIRRASFDTHDVSGKTVGFIVPTPNKPELEEVDNAVFATLETRLQEHYDEEAAKSSHGGDGGFGCGSDAAEAGNDGVGNLRGGVQVVEEKRLAGQDATVLLATDADALSAWLERNGFTLDSAMRDYLATYVEADAGWHFTAFRYDPAAADAKQVDTKAVSMRFSTPRAFYPYREAPTAASDNGRSLRVFTLASAPLRGMFDVDEACLARGSGCPTVWDAERLWATRIDDAFAAKLAPLGALPSTATLTIYEDRSNPRIGLWDLAFEENADLLTPTSTIAPLSGLVGSPLPLLALAAWLQRRKRSKTGEAPQSL